MTGTQDSPAASHDELRRAQAELAAMGEKENLKNTNTAQKRFDGVDGEGTRKDIDNALPELARADNAKVTKADVAAVDASYKAQHGGKAMSEGDIAAEEAKVFGARSAPEAKREIPPPPLDPIPEQKHAGHHGKGGGHNKKPSEKPNETVAQFLKEVESHNGLQQAAASNAEAAQAQGSRGQRHYERQALEAAAAVKFAQHLEKEQHKHPEGLAEVKGKVEQFLHDEKDMSTHELAKLAAAPTPKVPHHGAAKNGIG